jgi:hypothetical protein
MSFLRKYEQEMRKYTDAPDVFHTACAYALMGAALTKFNYRCLLSGGVPARWTNLWVFIVGDSAESRKSTCVNMAGEVLNRAMRGLRTPDDGSPEGFAKDFVMKEAQQRGDAAGLLIQSEMGMFLMNLRKEYMAPLKGMLMDFYDVPPVYRKKLSREEFSVSRPRFSMLGAVATELLPNLTSAEDWLGGFMNRALLIPGRRTRYVENAGTPDDGVYANLAGDMKRTLKAWQRTRKAAAKKMPKGTNGKRRTFLFEYSPEALKERKVLKKNLTKHLDPNVKLLHGRADVHLMKLAAIEQICMDPTGTTISKDALRAAWPLFQHWWDESPLVMEAAFARGNADLEGDRLARRLLRMVREAGTTGFTEQSLMQASVLDWERFNKAVMSLEAAGVVERHNTGEGGATIIRERAKHVEVSAEVERPSEAH